MMKYTKAAFVLLVLWTVATAVLVYYQNNVYQSFVAENPEVDFTSWFTYGIGPFVGLSAFWLVVVWVASVVNSATRKKLGVLCLLVLTPLWVCYRGLSFTLAEVPASDTEVDALLAGDEEFMAGIESLIPYITFQQAVDWFILPDVRERFEQELGITLHCSVWTTWDSDDGTVDADVRLQEAIEEIAGV